MEALVPEVREQKIDPHQLPMVIAGVNPGLTAITLARMVAEGILDELGARQAS